MNRRSIALVGAAGLLAAFFAAGLLYQSREAAQIEARSARHHAPPFVRDGAPTLGNEDARVVLVETDRAAPTESHVVVLAALGEPGQRHH